MPSASGERLDRHRPRDSEEIANLKSIVPGSRRRDSARVSMGLVPARSIPSHELVFTSPSVEIMVAFGTSSAREALESDRLQECQFVNRFHFMPADTVLTAVIDDPVPEVLAFSLDPEFASEVMGELFDGRMQTRPSIGNSSPALLSLGNAVRQQILSGRRMQALQLESIATLFLAEWSNSGESERPSQSIEKSIQRVNDYIQANLERDLSLAELAAEAQLSPSYFLRSFKKAIGQTPHRYLMDCRVQRAQEHLEKSTLALSEIAYACGFASQSHLNDVFRAKLGVSPGRYRRLQRS